MTFDLEKRIAAEKAEADFFALLRESGVVRSDSLWKDVSIGLPYHTIRCVESLHSR